MESENLTSELDDYKSHEPTKSCYLDGRYVNIVLKDVEDFIPGTINVRIVYDRDYKLISEYIGSDFLKLHDGMNIIRVVVKSNHTMHSALLWLNMKAMTATFTDIIVVERHEVAKHARKLVHKLVRDFVLTFGDFEFVVDNVEVNDPGSNAKCEMSGFCNAYVIKQVLDYDNDKDFDPKINILRFAGAVEDVYGDQLPSGEPEVEYRWGGAGFGRGGFGAGAGLGLGLLGGVALGSALAAPRYGGYGYGYPAPAYGYAPYYPPYGYSPYGYYA